MARRRIGFLWWWAAAVIVVALVLLLILFSDLAAGPEEDRSESTSHEREWSDVERQEERQDRPPLSSPHTAMKALRFRSDDAATSRPQSSEAKESAREENLILRIQSLEQEIGYLKQEYQDLYPYQLRYERLLSVLTKIAPAMIADLVSSHGDDGIELVDEIAPMYWELSAILGSTPSNQNVRDLIEIAKLNRRASETQRSYTELRDDRRARTNPSFGIDLQARRNAHSDAVQELLDYSLRTLGYEFTMPLTATDRP